MEQNSRFKPGQSGNPETRFKPGNPHRWQSGQSGNPSGIVRSCLKFEGAFFTALIEQGAPLEAAKLLWTCARTRAVGGSGAPPETGAGRTTDQSNS